MAEGDRVYASRKNRPKASEAALRMHRWAKACLSSSEQRPQDFVWLSTSPGRTTHVLLSDYHHQIILQKLIYRDAICWRLLIFNIGKLGQSKLLPHRLLEILAVKRKVEV